MTALTDLTNKKYNYLTVIKRVENDKQGNTQWLCKCDCGNTRIVRAEYLVGKKNGYQQKYCSHRCTFRLAEVSSDLTNQTFGRLKAVRSIGSSNANGEAIWEFTCDCGNVVTRSGVGVRRGHIQSCGCLFKDTHFKHGKSDTAEYRTQRTRKWREAHPERSHAMSRISQAKRLIRAPKWLTDEHKRQMSEFYILANRLTLETGIEHEVDHIYPLQGKLCSGLHVPWNLQVIPAKKNRRKSNNMPELKDIVRPEG
jgi:hypothetical protein